MTVTWFDLIYYLMDAILIGMMVRWMKNSRAVKIETQISMRWLIPSIFVIVAVVCVLNYEGIFRIIQTIAMLICAVLYYMQKSGLSDEGIVNVGSLTTYTQAGRVTVNRRDHNISFTYGKRKAILYFEPEQMDEVRAFLNERSKASK